MDRQFRALCRRSSTRICCRTAGGRCHSIVVITGSVVHFANRAELKDEIEKRGGKVTGSVTSKTNYLINNEITSSTVGYTYEFYWLFGMPIFLALLAYTIIKYHSFHIRLFGAQALVVGLVALIGAQFTFIRNPTNMVLNAIAFFLSVVFGFILVRSVKHEIQQHEHALELADNLAKKVGIESE